MKSLTAAASLSLALILLLASSSPPLLPRAGAAAVPEYDLVIMNGLIVDGTGRPAYTGDVVVRGDRIEIVGKSRPGRTRTAGLMREALSSLRAS